MKTIILSFVAFFVLATFLTGSDAARCYLCQNATGNCNMGECTSGVCYKTQAYYNAAGRQQEYVQKGCATTGTKGCTSVNLFSYSNAQQCICDTDFCNGVRPIKASFTFICVVSVFIILVKNLKLA